MKNVLILTASFGEGHNSAARAIKDAIAREAPHLNTTLVDAIASANPKANALMRKLYGQTLKHTPRVYKSLYDFHNRTQAIEASLPIMRRLRRELQRLLCEEQPAAIVSTYPLYSFIRNSLAQPTPPLQRTPPLLTVITDAWEVHSLWYRSPSDFWLVSDETTGAILREKGIAPAAIRVLGYPVATRCAEIDIDQLRLSPTGDWKVLFLPTSLRDLQKLTPALMQHSQVQLTLVLGHNQQLQASAQKLAERWPGRVTVYGWRSDVPELLANHHILVGKAGGATTHEALAMRIPMLIYKIIDGQEEGNARLMFENEAALPARSPEEAMRSLQQITQNDGELWHQMTQNAARLSTPDAAFKIARFVGEVCG